ncbi:Alpha-maltose-1-phosphate synthase [Gammaproteobacteria bacterium]|nr:Alpha-maltose-1-phosphate synthase [Gammaproteobacteria bacterium]
MSLDASLLLVNAAYPPFIGGAEVYTQTLAERFARDLAAVTLVTTNAGEVEFFWNPRKRHVTPGPEVMNGVAVTRCRVSHLPLAPLTFYGLRRLATLIARLPLDTRPLLRRLASRMPGVPDLPDTLERLPNRIDLVHGINIALEWPLIAAWQYARRHGLPFVMTPFVHVGEEGHGDVLINYVMPHQLEVLRDADAVIVQTDIERRALTQLGVRDDRLHRLGMGVDLETLIGGDDARFRARHQLTDPIVTFLGVVTYDKGSFHLVQALEKLWAQNQRGHLVIAGQPVDEFTAFYNRLSPATQQRILRLGPVTGQDKQDLLAATDVFALPSRIDSFGIVYLEAWAYRKPVIGARAGGVPDVIADGRDGQLVHFGNVDELAATIARLLATPSLAAQLGQAGRAKVEQQYTWDRIIQLTYNIYTDLLNRRTHAPRS